MKTNTKAVKDRIKNYLLENVTDENDNVFTSFKVLASHIKHEVIKIFGYVNQSTFKKYMQGLPTGNFAAGTMFYFHYHDYNIVLGGILGENEEEYTKYTPEKAVDLGVWLFYRELSKFF